MLLLLPSIQINPQSSRIPEGATVLFLLKNLFRFGGEVLFYFFWIEFVISVFHNQDELINLLYVISVKIDHIQMIIAEAHIIFNLDIFFTET